MVLFIQRLTFLCARCASKLVLMRSYRRVLGGQPQTSFYSLLLRAFGSTTISPRRNNDVAEESPLNLDPLALDCARGEAPFGGVCDRGHEAEPKPRVELLGKGRAILLCLSLPAPSKEQYRYCITVLYGTGTVPYIVQF